MEDGVALGEQADEAEVVVGVGVGDEDRIHAEEAGGDLGIFSPMYLIVMKKPVA